MNSTPNPPTHECEGVQELIVWYPTGTLEAAESTQVEEHAATCAACAELLQFSALVQEAVTAAPAVHPEAEVLVRFAEERTALDVDRRARVEEHLAACSECRHEVTMLETVERNLADAPQSSFERASSSKAAGMSEADESSMDSRSGLRRLWDTLTAGVLQPVPAAIYLTVAVVALGLNVLGPDAPNDGSLPRAFDLASPPGGVTILVDETDVVRQVGSDPTPVPVIDARAPQFLLLELTGLEAPPEDDAMYTVELTSGNTGTALLTSTIAGRAFRDSYTICLPLEAGVLEPGSYVARVTGPKGEVIFRGPMAAR